MTDLTETLKRVRQLAGKAIAADLTKMSAKEYFSTKQAFIHAANPQAVLAILDELERVTGERDAAKAYALDCSIRAYKWMVAHDRLKAGVAYEFPKPADVPEAYARVTSLERELAQAKAQMRTPGARECCPDCGVTWDPEDGPWDLRLCNLNPNASPSVLERYCAIKRAHSPAVKEAE